MAAKKTLRATVRPDELAQARRLLEGGQGALARLLLESMLERAPTAVAVHRLLAVQALGAEDAPRALHHAGRASQLAPHDAQAALLVGRSHKAAGQPADAETAYRTALRLDPRLAEAHVSLGIVLKQRGDLPAAIDCYRRALAIAPDLAAAKVNLGIAMALHLDRVAVRPGADDAPNGPSPETLEHLQAAIDADGHNIAARQNLAVALVHAGRLEDAAQQLNTALALDPRRQDSCIALHTVLTRLHWLEGARQCCEQWLAINPPQVEVVNRLVTTLLVLRDFDAAGRLARQALEMAPDMPEVRHNLANLLQQSLDVPSALAHVAHAVAVAPGYLPAWQTWLMCLNYAAEDPEPIAEAHRRYGQHIDRAEAPAVDQRLAAAPPPGRRLRVGWVSGDFRRHSVAYFIEPLFEAHDRNRADWIAYDNGQLPDDVTQRLQRHAQGWVACAGLSDEALAQRIRADGIDILVDLGGHTADSRIGVFTHRSAPVQITYLGYPTTTGLPSVGWRLTDAVIDPDDGRSERLSVERLLRLPRGMFCYRPDTDLPPAPSPALRNGHVTFGSFNNLAKLTPATLRLWAAVLQAVPGSRLLIKAQALTAPSAQALLTERFAQLGITADRLLLNPWRPDLASHLELYHAVDIGLDSYPYNGATTTCEALWMGVPVLTLQGRTHVSRMGASILQAAGLADWVSHSPEAFVAAAVERARDLAALATLRDGLRTHLQGSALLDAGRQTADLESLLDIAWAAHAAPRAPQQAGSAVEATSP